MEKSYKVLMISDTHFTSKQVDSYRWKFFHQLHTIIDNNNIKELFILGDLTDAKDRHPSLLVNMLVSNLKVLAQKVYIKIIKGNHDYVDADHPYFEFLNNIDNVEFYSSPMSVNIQDFNLLFLPHTRDYVNDWAVWDFNDHDYIFMHETLNGSKASDSHVMESNLSLNYFGGVNKEIEIYSGDIHVPQQLGDRFWYVGSPYHVRFGDNFVPRVIIKDLYKRNFFSYQTNGIKKSVLKIKDANELKTILKNYKNDDLIKVEVVLSKSDYADWVNIKNKCLNIFKEFGLECQGILPKKIKRVRLVKNKKQKQIIVKNNPVSVLKSFSKKENLSDDLIQTGLELL